MSSRNISRYHQGPMRGTMCPKCGRGNALARSRVRWHERWRKILSAKLPYRCHLCQARMWLSIDELQTVAAPLITRR